MTTDDLVVAQQWAAWFAAERDQVLDVLDNRLGEATGMLGDAVRMLEHVSTLDSAGEAMLVEAQRWAAWFAARVDAVDAVFAEWDSDYPRGSEGVETLTAECESHVKACYAARDLAAWFAAERDYERQLNGLALYRSACLTLRAERRRLDNSWNHTAELYELVRWLTANRDYHEQRADLAERTLTTAHFRYGRLLEGAD